MPSTQIAARAKVVRYALMSEDAFIAETGKSAQLHRVFKNCLSKWARNKRACPNSARILKVSATVLAKLAKDPKLRKSATEFVETKFL